MRRLLVTILLFGLTLPLSAKERVNADDYKGKVYREVRIDDRGVTLIDSAGNEVQVQSSRAGGEQGEFAPIPPIPPEDVNLESPPGSYPDTVGGISHIGFVSIAEDEYVDGSVVVVGNATIKGRVAGSVTATGQVRISETGVVEGDVTGSRVTVDPGARVLGRVLEQHINIPFPEGEWPVQSHNNSSAPAIVGLILLLLQLGIAVGIATLFEKSTEKLKAVFHENIFKALLVGFVFEIASPVVFVVLIITIIGIPIAFIALPLAVVAAGFLGFAAFCLYVSDYVRSKDAVEANKFQQILIGFVILQVPWIGFFLGLVIDSQAMAIVFGIVAGILFFIVFTASLGAAILTRFGSRSHGGRIDVEHLTGAPFEAATEQAIAPEVKSLDARISMAAGYFRLLKSAEGGALATLKGNFRADRFRYDYRFTPTGESAELRFATETLSKSMSNLEGRENDWQIEFAPEVNLGLRTTIGAARCGIDAGDLTLTRLELEIGAADAKVDFSAPNRTMLDRLKVEAGACKLEIHNIGNSRFRLLEFDGGVGKFLLDFRGQFDYRAEARVKVGMGAMTIVIPQGLGLQLRADEGWTSKLDLSRANLVAVAGRNFYETRDFDGAAGQLILMLEVGLGTASIEVK